MITLKCKKHPRYMAKREPTSACKACHFLFVMVTHEWFKKCCVNNQIKITAKG